MSIFDSKSLRGLIIAVILYITSLNALYIPEEIQGWTYTSIQPTGSSPFYYNFTYNNIIGPPRSFMAGLVGIRSSSTGSIDIQVNATLLSTKMMVTITKGATWLLDQVDFSYMMTNDGKWLDLSNFSGNYSGKELQSSLSSQLGFVYLRIGV